MHCQCQQQATAMGTTRSGFKTRNPLSQPSCQALPPTRARQAQREPTGQHILPPRFGTRMQPVASVQDQGTKPCRLRFINNWDEAIDVLWLNFEGDEVCYAELELGEQHVQETYTTHPWRLKAHNSGEVVGSYVGNDATLEASEQGTLLVCPGFSAHVQVQGNPSSFGAFVQRGTALKILIMAFSCVDERAVKEAERLLYYMLCGTPAAIKQKLLANGCDVAIIGRNQVAPGPSKLHVLSEAADGMTVTSDIPAHRHLKGKTCGSDRTFDHGTRGLGGTTSVPTTSVGEENLLMLDDRHYPDESILVHEFAHTVMTVGMAQHQQNAIRNAYQHARDSGLYSLDIYAMQNADEYWAEGTQSWFDATARTDVNGGVCTREHLKWHDPHLAVLMVEAYGDGPWRYLHTAPGRFASSKFSGWSEPMLAFPGPVRPTPGASLETLQSSMGSSWRLCFGGCLPGLK